MPYPSTFWNSRLKLRASTNGAANQKPNVSNRLAWVLVELMMSHTIGISVKTANTTQAVVMAVTVPRRRP